MGTWYSPIEVPGWCADAFVGLKMSLGRHPLEDEETIADRLTSLKLITFRNEEGIKHIDRDQAQEILDEYKFDQFKVSF